LLFGKHFVFTFAKEQFFMIMKEKETEKETLKDTEQGDVNDNTQSIKDSKSEKKEAKSKKKEKEHELEEKLNESQDKYIRLAAEFDNYRRRSAKERLELINTASEEVIKGILPIVDDFERAIEVLSKSEGSEAAKEGTELIYNKMVSFLKSKGVEKIESLGQSLDTDKHEAVAQFPVQEEDKKNKILDVTQHGYTLHGKVIRFAKVVLGV
jgi:molecular chaperone GrpE